MSSVGDCLRRPKGHLARLVAKTDQLARVNRVFHAYLPVHLREHAALTAIGQQNWTVQTDSPAWATRLRYVLPSLQQQLSDHLGHTVPPLQIRIKPTEAAASSSEPTRRMSMTQESANLLAGAAHGVKDQRLGAALLKLSAHAQQRNNDAG